MDAVTPDATSPWWRSGVVYQIYPRSFADSNGDGIGDLRGILGRVGYLQNLGIDAVWLSPVYPSPQADNGYDVSDYCAIDPMYGTMADFDAVLAALHAAGIRLVLDLVLNHSSDEHPWFVESRASKHNPRRDWYHWRPPRPGYEPGTPGAEPNNWGSSFSGPAWTFNRATGDYYLHLFGAKQPDLNWSNPDVRAALYDVMRFWLDKGVDGFRLDVIDMISKNPALPDVPLRPGEVYGDGSPHYAPGPHLHTHLQEMRREVLTGRDRHDILLLGETPFATAELAVLYTDPARGELDMIFQFEHVMIDHGATKWDVLPFDLAALTASLSRWQRALEGTGWNSLYWSNHDQPRVVSRFGDDGDHRVRAAKMLGTVLHLHRGTPFIYQGEELGMTNASFADIDDFQDIEARNHYAAETARGRLPDDLLAGLRPITRDNARTPVQWDRSEHSGFTTGTPWMAVNANYPTINAEDQLADADSVLNYYRRLVTLRHEERLVSDGSYELLPVEHPQVYAFRRRLADAELVVVASFSSSPLSVDVPALAASSAPVLVLDNLADAPHLNQGRLDLRPWEACVYRTVASAAPQTAGRS